MALVALTICTPLWELNDSACTVTSPEALDAELNENVPAPTV